MGEYDVAIVGAGLAGLNAARAVRAAGLRAVVVEARDRVGGRTLNEPLGDGKIVEVGGQWVGPTQHRLLALAAELGVDTFPTYDEGENVIEYRGALRRYRGAIPRIDPLALAAVGVTQRRIDAMARSVPLDAPWTAERAERWDGETLRSWIRRNVPSRGARELLEIAVESIWSVPSSDLSVLHALFYIHSAGGFDALINTSGGAQERRFVGGSQIVSQRLAERLTAADGDGPPVELLLSTPVRRLRHRADGVELLADGPDGEPERVTLRAGRAIVAIPPTLCGRIAYEPALPAHRDQLTQHMPQGAIIKCVAIYDEPFWRQQGLTGQATSDRGPIRITFDNSPPDGRPGALLGFLEGRWGREWGRRSLDERRDAVIDCFTRLFGPRAAHPERYVERAWANEEWTRGCYGCAFTPGGWTAFGDALRAPIGPIHWAGAETATVWSGYMDGAIQSGERAAQEALAALERRGSAAAVEESVR